MNKLGQGKTGSRSRSGSTTRSRSRSRGLTNAVPSRKGSPCTSKGSLPTSGTKLKNRARKIASIILKEYPQARTTLKHRSALQLLIATILSAQCTDVRVNIVTKELFKKYRTATDFAEANPNELEQEIHSLGFYRQKTRSIVACCRDIVEKYGGRVPDTMEGLTSLRGVGRKTANVVLGNFYGKPAVVVDTHVRRLSVRLGLTTNTDPALVEQDLMELLPDSVWTPFTHALLLHGRAVCPARKPRCEACPVAALCPSSTI